MRASLFFLALVALIISVVSAMPVIESSPIAEQASTQQVARDEIELESRAAAVTSPRITFYSGQQLNNPACGGPTPSSKAMVAAVKNGGHFKCGDWLHISKGGKSVKVKVVDYCGSCSNKAIDLTPGAFKKLAKLSDGVITGARVWKS